MEVFLARNYRNYEASNQLLDKYLIEISRENLLTADEEKMLAKSVKEGGKKGDKAKDRLIKANLRFVVSVAKQYQNQGLNLIDLINEGNMGLIKAVSRFDESRDIKFISYAVWWIRQAILQALAEQCRIVRLPLNKISMVNKVSKTRSRLEKQFEREPTAEEIAEVMDITKVQIDDVITISGRHLSIDAPLSDNGKDKEKRLIDLLKNGGDTSPDKELFKASLRHDIDEAMASLNLRERNVIKLYFGIDTNQTYTLEEIGKMFTLTRERVRQIKEKALKRMRHPSRAKFLRTYLG